MPCDRMSAVFRVNALPCAVGPQDDADRAEDAAAVEEKADAADVFALRSVSSSSRPFTCAQPVRPGRRSFAPLRSRSAMRSFWFRSAGRGPTMLRSWVIAMFQSWGSSSRLQRRRKRPARVIWRSGFSSRCDGTSGGVSTRIVRNLRILKQVSSPFLRMPTRRCRNSTGPGSSITITTAISAHSHSVHTSPRRPSSRSRTDLMYLV